MSRVVSGIQDLPKEMEVALDKTRCYDCQGVDTGIAANRIFELGKYNVSIIQAVQMSMTFPFVVRLNSNEDGVIIKCTENLDQQSKGINIMRPCHDEH